MLKKLNVVGMLFLVIAPVVLIGCSGEETPKADPNAPPPMAKPPAASGKAQGGAQAPSIKMDGSK